MRWWDGQQWTDAYAPVVRAQVVPQTPISAISITGFVLSVIGLALSGSGYFGAALGVLGVVLSIGGYADRHRRGRGFAVAGSSSARPRLSSAS